MKLKYVKLLLLLFTLGTISSCWWDSDSERVDVPTLVYYSWSLNANDNNLPEDIYPYDEIVYTFKDNGAGYIDYWYNGDRKPDRSEDFNWVTGRRAGTNFIELAILQGHNRPKAYEYLFDVDIDNRRAVMSAIHYLNEREFDELRLDIPRLYYKGLR